MNTTTTTNDWLAWRNAGLGGSDAAVIFGFSPWKTELELWLEKTGQKPAQPPSRAMRIGKALEPLVIDLWCEQTGGAVIDRDVRVEHRAWPIARGTLDAIVELEGHRLVLEAKTSRSSGWRDGVPPYYVAQAQWYLMLTGLQRCEVAALFDGADLITFSVHADQELHQRMLEAAQSWWYLHVVHGVEPKVTTPEDARWARSFRHKVEETVELDAEAASDLIRLAGIKESIRRLESTARDLEASILSKAPPAKRVHAQKPDGSIVRAVWCQSVRRVTLDVEALRRDHPEILSKYQRTTMVPGYLRVLI